LEEDDDDRDKRITEITTGAMIMKRARVRLGLVICGNKTLPYLIIAAPATEPTPIFNK
jgi:hypothetical protein